jgi:serine/threonine-protein kinase
MTLQPGQEIGTYRVIQKIGEGGFGAVYTAEDTAIGRQVVLKVLSTDVAGDQEMLQRFQREVEMIARL